MILFLDFDGVLHPDAVFLIGGHPILARGGQTFMWAQPLIDLLISFPEISIVLSTPWVRHLGFSRAKAALPEQLRTRVIGSTWHLVMGPNLRSMNSASEDWYDNATRYEHIARVIARGDLYGEDWIAIDHSEEGWPKEQRHRLVKTDRKNGLSCPELFEGLKTRVAEIYSGHVDPNISGKARVLRQLEANIEA